MFGRLPQSIHRRSLFGITCLLICIFSSKSYASWEIIARFPRLVGAGYFFNAQRGIITVDGEFGDLPTGTPSAPPQIWRTYNGGITWLPSVVPAGYTGLAFNDVFMKDSLNGWVVFEAVYSNQNMWRTVDGGVTWFEVNGYVEEASSVYETSKGVLYTHRGLRFTSDRGLFQSKDNGTTFTKLENLGLNGLGFVDDDHGVASTFNSTTLVTSDGGDTWLTTPQNTEAWGVYGEKGTPNFLIAAEQLASSSSTVTNIARSTDYGFTWTYIHTLPFRNTGHIEGVGKTAYVQLDFNFINYQGLFRTTDGGFSWKNVGGPSHLRDTRFCVTGCNGAVVYAFDPFGNVYKTIDGGDGLLLDDEDHLIFTNRLLSVTADICSSDDDSTRFINSTCYPLTIIDINFSNPLDEVVTSTALSFTSKPALPITLQSGQSASVRVKWDPKRSSQSVPATNQFVRFTCVSQSGVGVFDTLIPLSAASIGRELIAQLDSSAFTFAPTNFCTYRDTILSIRNPGCDTIYVTDARFDNISNWRIVTADGQDLPLTLPIAIPPGSQVKVKVQFTPTKTGYASGNLAFEFTQRNTIIDTSLFMQATSFRANSISSLESVDFGTVSMCNFSDTTVTYTNETCEELIIDWINLTSLGAFILVDSPAFPITLKPDSTLSLTIRYLPAKYVLDNAQLTLHATATGDPLIINMLLVGLGTHGSSQYKASIDNSPLVFSATDFCGVGDTITFSVNNPGCDSLVVEDVVLLSGSTGIFTYETSASIPNLILGTDDSLQIRLYSVPTSVGMHSATFRVRFRLADGMTRDTVYTMSFSVSPGPRTLSLSPSSIQYGTLPLCIEHDSTLTLTNIGCADVTVDSLLISDQHFQNLSSITFPKIIQRGESIVVPIRYSSASPGSFSGDVTIWTNADSLPIRVLPLAGTTIDKDYLTLSLLSLADKPYAGDTVQVVVVSDRDWIGKGVKNVSFTLDFNSDLLTYSHTIEPPSTDLQEVYSQTSPDAGQLKLTISSDNEVRFEKNSPLAVITFITALTDTLYTPITLSDVTINGNDQYYKDCVLGTSEQSDGFTLHLACGESPLQNYLTGEPLLFVSHPTPNPLTNRSGFRLTLPIQSSIQGDGEFRLIDIKGNERTKLILGKLSKGLNHLTIDLRNYDSGIYQYYLSIKDYHHSPVTGKIVIIK